MLRARIVQGVGWCPVVSVVARTVHWQGMQGGRFAFTKLGVVSGCRGAHASHIDRTGGATHQYKFTEGDVVQTEVVAASHRVLIQNGDGGRCRVATIPKLVELSPLVNIRRRRKNVSDLISVNAELKQGHLVGSTGKRTHPCGKCIVGIRIDSNLLCPDIGSGTGGTIYNHEIAAVMT